MSGEMVPLVDAVRALRSQLKLAVEESKSENLRFELGTVELEFNVVVSREGSGGGKISFKLFGQGAEVNAGVKISDQQVQKIKLVMKPRDFTDDEVKDVAISSNRKNKTS